MEIDFIAGKPVINELAWQLIITLGVPLIIALLIIGLLKFLRVPSMLIKIIAIVAFLFGVYKMFMKL